MSRIVKPITVKVTSKTGKMRLTADIRRKHELKAAIQNKVPSKQIEKDFGVKFVKPI